MKFVIALVLLSVLLETFADDDVSIQDLESELKKYQTTRTINCSPKNPHLTEFRNMAGRCSEFDKKYGMQNVKTACIEPQTNFHVITYTRALCVKGQTGPNCRTVGKYERRIHASAGGLACIDRPN